MYRVWIEPPFQLQLCCCAVMGSMISWHSSSRHKVWPPSLLLSPSQQRNKSHQCLTPAWSHCLNSAAACVILQQRGVDLCVNLTWCIFHIRTSVMCWVEFNAGYASAWVSCLWWIKHLVRDVVSKRIINEAIVVLSLIIISLCQVWRRSFCPRWLP